ncbi:MAG: hypothetical protein KatS3mg023_2314 [Armatimonadota bacterium]|nr:MAG: hypothetical protein KatS3mg023_2314 [Armatimonadota bacterium]
MNSPPPLTLSGARQCPSFYLMEAVATEEDSPLAFRNFTTKQAQKGILCRWLECLFCLMR